MMRSILSKLSSIYIFQFLIIGLQIQFSTNILHLWCNCTFHFSTNILHLRCNVLFTFFLPIFCTSGAMCFSLFYYQYFAPLVQCAFHFSLFIFHFSTQFFKASKLLNFHKTFTITQQFCDFGP